MTLTATNTQSTFSVDATSFTTSSSSPTSGALYVVFGVGRLGPITTARNPTLSGTNGWNTTWTKVAAAQAIYGFSGDRCQTDVWWGIASSGSAGTITIDYIEAGNYAAATINVIQIGGGPNLGTPVGATGTAHDDTGSASNVSATMTGTPAASSIVVACGATDVGAATPTAGSGYALFSTTSNPDAGSSALEFDATSPSATVAMSWSAADILSISALEIVEGPPTPIPRVGPDRRAGN